VYTFTRHNLGLISLILLLAMAVACRGETPPLATSPVSSPSPTRTTPTLQPTPSPTKAIVISTPSPKAPYLSGGSIEKRAQEALANRLGISREEIEVIKVEEVEWPDTSLGCPEPGMVYTQVIVPGWRVVMRVNNAVYEYHSGGLHGVLCDQEGHLISILPSPTVTPITVPSAPTPTLEDICPMMLVAPHGKPCTTPWMPGH